MRLLTVHPGADVSTSDVYEGMVPALQAHGVECVPYALSARIANEGHWLHSTWRRRRKLQPDLERPTDADVIYRAGVGIIERALRLQPDWVLVFSGMYLHPDILIMCRRAGIRVAMILSESPYDEIAEQRVLPLVDVAWTNERSCVDRYRQINPRTYYMAHAFDPARHRPSDDDDPDVPAHDVVFVGTGFPERIETLAAVNWDGIDFGLYGSWDLLPSRHPLRRHLRDGIVCNARAAALYRRAKVGLNLYRSSIGFGKANPRIDYAESVNPRALELAATECFQISDQRVEVWEHFGHSVPTFRSPSELEDRLRWYLDPVHDRVRRQMAAWARVAVQPHTFHARARQVVDDLDRASQSLAA